MKLESLRVRSGSSSCYYKKREDTNGKISNHGTSVSYFGLQMNTSNAQGGQSIPTIQTGQMGIV